MTHRPSSADNPKDSEHHGWVDRIPQWFRPYFLLSRLDRPIGVWLLFWPCAWSVLYFSNDWLQRLKLLVIFAFGSLVMRGAGCTWNDYLDLDLDRRIERTRNRPLPSGQVTPLKALVWLVTQLGLGGVCLLFLPVQAQLIAIAALLLVAVYPLMKRVTWWPQAWLGLTFNWGVLVGAAAVDGLNYDALWLYYGGVFWTLGYDTIYAIQDLEDDSIVGVKSSARLLGRYIPSAVVLFYALALACWGVALDWHPALLLVVSHFLWQSYHIWTCPVQVQDAQDAISHNQLALKLFRSNRTTGFLLAVAIMLL